MQYGPLTVDGLTFDGISGYASSVPMIQLSDNNPTGSAVWVRFRINVSFQVGIVAFWGLEPVYKVDSSGGATVTIPAIQLPVA